MKHVDGKYLVSPGDLCYANDTLSIQIVTIFRRKLIPYAEMAGQSLCVDDGSVMLREMGTWVGRDGTSIIISDVDTI